MRPSDARRCELAAVDLLCRQHLASIYDMAALDVRKFSLPIRVTFADFSDFCRRTGADRARFCSQGGKSAEGLSLRFQGEYLILYDETIKNPRRILFTLAHELGHILLGHAEEKGETAEREAHCFAAALLAPTVALRYLATRDGPLCAERLTAVFPLSQEAAVHRLAMLERTPILPPSDSEITLLLHLFGTIPDRPTEE